MSARPPARSKVLQPAEELALTSHGRPKFPLVDNHLWRLLGFRLIYNLFLASVRDLTSRRECDTESISVPVNCHFKCTRFGVHKARDDRGSLTGQSSHHC